MLTVGTKLVAAAAGVVDVIVITVLVTVVVMVGVVILVVVIVIVLKGLVVWTLGLQVMDTGQKWSSNVISFLQSSKDSHESMFSTLTQVALNPYF